MRTPILFGLLVSFLIQLSFAFTPTYLDPTIERPWEFNSVYLPDYITTILLNGPEQTDLDTSYLYSIDPSIAPHVTNEINQIKAADSDYTRIGQTKYLIMELIKSWFNETAHMSSTAMAPWLFSNIGLFFIYDVGTGVISSTTYYGMELLSLCSGHYSAAADSVEKSEKAYNILLAKVVTGYDELKHMGATSAFYSGVYSNDIAQLESTLKSIDGTHLASGESNVKFSAKSTSTSGQAYRAFISHSMGQVKYLLDGKDSVLAKLFFAYSLENYIKTGLLDERAAILSNIKSRDKAVSSEYSRISGEYGQITDADVVYFGISTLETLDSPSVHIAKASAYMSSYSSELIAGDTVYASKAPGYVVESIGHYYKSSASLDSAQGELKKAESTGKLIIGLAAKATMDQYTQAVSDASAFVPKTDAEARQLAAAKDLIEKAKQYMDKGNTASEKIANLKIAYNYLQLARASLSPSTVFSANARDSAQSSLQYLKSVIDRAKLDSIDVSYEESYYNEKMAGLKSGNIQLQEMVNITLVSGNLTEQIFARGAAQYESLSQRYASVAPLAQYFQSLDGKQLKEYAQLNSYVGKGGKFDKYLSLGHYREIEGLISGLELQIQFKSKELIAESMRMSTKVSAYYGNASFYIDSPVTRYVAIMMYSTLDLNYSGIVSVTVPFSHDITSSQSISDPPGIQYSFGSGKLLVLIPQYKPNRIYSLKFEDSQVLARTLSIKQTTELVSPTRLKATVERQFMSAGMPQLLIPPYYDYPYTLYYDGEYVGSFNYDATVSRQISPGTHRLTLVYLIDNPFIVAASSISRTGTSTSIRLTASSTVPFDLENVPITYDMPVISPSTATVSSPNCALISHSRTAYPSFTRITATIKSLPAKSSCTIDASVNAPLDKDAIQEAINTVVNDSDAKSIPSVIGSISKAQRSLDSGNLDDALKAVDDAKGKLAEAKQEALQMNRTSSEVQRLNSEISSVLTDLSQVKNADVQKSLAKAKAYYDAAQAETADSKKLPQLQKANEQLLNLNAIAYSQLSDLSTRLSSLKQKWLYLIDKGYAKSLPQELTAVEAILANVTLATSPSSSTFAQLENASSQLFALEQSIKLAEKGSSEWESSLKERHKAAVSALKSALAQLNKACGTKCPQELVSYSESLLSLVPSTPGEYTSAIDKLNSTLSSIHSYVESERTAANFAIGDLKSALSALSDQNLKNALAKKIYEIEALYQAGSYARAKDAALAAKLSLADAPQRQQDDFSLIFAGIAVIAIAFILLKMRENSSKAQEEISKQVKELKREK